MTDEKLEEMEVKKISDNKLEKIVDVVKKHLQKSDTKVIDVEDLTKGQVEELKNYLKDYNTRVGGPYISAKKDINEKLYYMQITNKIKINKNA